MPFNYPEYQWDCPECEMAFGNGGKSKEKYIKHLESHLMEDK